MNYDYILIDVSSLFHQLYHKVKKYEQQGTYQPLYKNLNGQKTYVSTLKFYVRKIMDLRKAYPNSEFVHVLDSKENFRKQIDSNYKAHRPEKDVELETQLNMLPAFLNYLGEANVMLNGYEADDLIGTLVANEAQSNKNVLIYSRDKDLLQLMFDSDRFHFLKEFSFMQGRAEQKIINSHAQVKELMGVESLLIPEMLAIMGDSSDNIIGVKGLGEKKAAYFINKFGDFATGINNLSSFPTEYQRIFEDKENVERVLHNCKLTLINIEAPITMQNIFENKKEPNYKLISNLIEVRENLIPLIKPRTIANEIDNMVSHKGNYKRNP